MVANGISLSRLPLLAFIVALLYFGGPWLRALAFGLTLLLIWLDSLDGIVARRRGEVSELGSVIDIATDRVVENVYWIVYADLDLIPVWVPLLVVARGILTDSIRGYVMAQAGETAFGMMKTPWMRWLVSGRFMRGLYGVMKALIFAALAGFMALRDLYPAAPWLVPLHGLLLALTIATVAITIARGLPVLLESRRYIVAAPRPASAQEGQHG